MSVVGTIVVAAPKIISAARFIGDMISEIGKIKAAISNILTTDMPRVWKSEKNADSNVFALKMQELETDINDMLDTLKQYEDLLDASAKGYETTQQNVYNDANRLRSPTKS